MTDIIGESNVFMIFDIFIKNAQMHPIIRENIIPIKTRKKDIEDDTQKPSVITSLDKDTQTAQGVGSINSTPIAFATKNQTSIQKAIAAIFFDNDIANFFICYYGYYFAV